ncbi:hypothetical protein SH668x_001172 [Planctomicrobium sp. SH668]|uniref:hypothetical protein n=1 Tax=Planctomicrobium sp. SH668 TaxID=3448126 RepID=UPI003F5BE920
MQRATLLFFITSVLMTSSSALAQPEDFQGAVAGPQQTTLFSGKMTRAGFLPLPKSSELLNLDELQFTGPKPSHPHVLGNFATTGSWGLVNGMLGVVEGSDTALQLAWAGDFELEGIMEQQGFGGWYCLVGWDDGRGFGIHNVVMKQSGSPWFVSEFRGSKAIEEGTIELEKFEWKGAQPFRMTVQNEELTLKIGKFTVIDRVPLEGYQPGRIILGTYDSRYGPKTMLIKSLKIRALSADDKTPQPKK